MDFLEKLRNQPDNIRKAIVWGITIFLGLIFIALWFFYSYNKIKNLNSAQVIKQLDIPNFNSIDIEYIENKPEE